MKKILTVLTLSVMGLSAMAQGQPSANIFSNFNYNLSEEDNNFKAFEVNRAYLGYAYEFSDEFSTKITFDMGNNSAGSAYTAFLKIASLSWKANENININFGMIGTKNFKFMEKTWGHRYIYKSEDVIVRVHRDVVPRESYGMEDSHQNTTSAALAYKGDGFGLGAEYNLQENAKNVSDQERTGISAYGSYDLNDGMSLFGRYDELSSEDDWNLSKDGTFVIIGVQKQMVKGVKVALNYQSWTAATDGAEAENTVFMNIQCKF